MLADVVEIDPLQISKLQHPLPTQAVLKLDRDVRPFRAPLDRQHPAESVQWMSHQRTDRPFFEIIREPTPAPTRGSAGGSRNLHFVVYRIGWQRVEEGALDGPLRNAAEHAIFGPR